MLDTVRATMPEFDLHIRNGSVIDGSGTLAFRADVAVRDGRIAAVGAIGMERSEPDEAELARMQDAVAEGMAAGALGLSTGLIYPPGAFARTDEIIALAKVAAEHGGVYMTHMRDEGTRLLEAIEEAVRIAREAGLPLEISHHKAAGRENWGKTEQSIALIEKEREAGVDVTFDAYPYTAGSTILAVMARRPEAGPDSVMVSSVRGKPEFEGKTLTQIAEMLGVAPDEAAPRVLEAYPSAVAVFFMMDEADVRRVLAHSLCMVGSDGIPSRTGKPHPRLYGTFPRVLGTYVREERLFPLEEGVRKMTSLPARRMNLAGRGELREGFAADIVVFDPKTIADRATYEESRKYPAGIDYVIVNGRVAAEGGKQTAARAGRLLRRSKGRSSAND